VGFAIVISIGIRVEIWLFWVCVQHLTNFKGFYLGTCLLLFISFIDFLMTNLIGVVYSPCLSIVNVFSFEFVS
jgi:hypothetical protein